MLDGEGADIAPPRLPRSLGGLPKITIRSQLGGAMGHVAGGIVPVAKDRVRAFHRLTGLLGTVEEPSLAALTV
jgi:hypothetical protein